MPFAGYPATVRVAGAGDPSSSLDATGDRWVRLRAIARNTLLAAILVGATAWASFLIAEEPSGPLRLNYAWSDGSDVRAGGEVAVAVQPAASVDSLRIEVVLPGGVRLDPSERSSLVWARGDSPENDPRERWVATIDRTVVGEVRVPRFVLDPTVDARGVVVVDVVGAIAGGAPLRESIGIPIGDLAPTAVERDGVVHFPVTFVQEDPS